MVAFLGTSMLDARGGVGDGSLGLKRALDGGSNSNGYRYSSSSRVK